MPDTASIPGTTLLVIDGKEIAVPSGYTLLQACEAAGAEIPRFCYHEQLSIAGNCRMCLVEWKGAPKPVASCAQTVGEMRSNPDGSPPCIFTGSPRTIKARQAVMEFLLINHPLDCPICDQGGECDLQDQAIGYGRVGSRYNEEKRAVEDKYIGPLIKTIMTRCIQCTRCVRFAAEIAGVEELGMVGRGENARITTCLEQSMCSELSGNVIDLCPVGALTSRPYAFTARPWELEHTDSIDVMDALGSHIRLDTRGGEVMRILPRMAEDINGEWISDKTRFVWDGLKRQRIDTPYLRKDGRLVPVRWSEALDKVAERLSGAPEKIAALAGDLACVEGMKALLDLLRLLGVMSTDCRQDGARIAMTGNGKAMPRQSWLFNAGLAGVDRADAMLIIGADPRREAAILNARIRQAWLHGGMEAGLIGHKCDLTYDYAHLGVGPRELENIASHGFFQKTLLKAERPLILLGQRALARPDGEAVLHLASALAARLECEDGWEPFNILHQAAAYPGGLGVGFLPGAGGLGTESILAAAQEGGMDSIILLGADEIDSRDLGDSFVIYIGSHGDAGAARADIVLPAAAYSEKNAIYVNTEGRAQQTQCAAALKGEALPEWQIIHAIASRIGKNLPYADLESLRAALSFAHPELDPETDFAPDKLNPPLRESFAEPGALNDTPFAPPPQSFYLTNPIARASKTMGECASQLKKRQ